MTNPTNTNDTVILISIDTLRADCFGQAADPLWKRDYPTCVQPAQGILDELRKEGTFFGNVTTAAPYTSASHAAILTGCWPLRNGVKEVFGTPLSIDSVFTRLHRAGFKTALKTDFPLIIGQSLGFTRDVDDFIIEDDQQFLDSIEDRPFFGLCHFSGAHYPYGFHNLAMGGEDYRETVAALEAELPLNLDETPDRIDETYRVGEDRELLLRYKRIIKHLFDHQQWDRLFQLYLDGTAVFLEQRFRKFFEALKQKLAGRRALIVVFGDHGEHWSTDSYGHHNSMREGVLQIPMLFLADEIPKARTLMSRIRTIDLAPTILDWLGQTPSNMDGQSLHSVLAGGPPNTPRTAFTQAWNCEPEEFVKVQEAARQKPDEPSQLTHFLTGEAVYHANYRMVRKYHTYENEIASIAAAPTEVVIEEFDKDLIPRRLAQSDHHAAVEKRLNALLDAYQQMETAKGRATAVAPEGDLRIQLADFGYRIL